MGKHPRIRPRLPQDNGKTKGVEVDGRYGDTL